MMKLYILFNLVALVCSQVNCQPSGNQSHEHTYWDTYNCKNLASVVDSQTILIATFVPQTLWPKHQLCQAIRTDMKVCNESDYTMSADFIINAAGTGPGQEGYAGLAFNYLDSNNYDYVYRMARELNQPGSYGDKTVMGHIKNGKFYQIYVEPAATNDEVQFRQWYNFKIEVALNKDVKVFLNDVLVTNATMTAHFATFGYGGVAVPNGKDNVAQFRNFDVSPTTLNLD